MRRPHPAPRLVRAALVAGALAVAYAPTGAPARPSSAHERAAPPATAEPVAPRAADPRPGTDARATPGAG
jgi:hypothetical protein